MAGDGSKDADPSDDACQVQCALVEYVRGVKSKKWTLVLGEVYQVGRNGTGADIEIEHPSMSRRQCSLALTQVESDIVLVALDKGSTNGTFVNKQRLEKGVGLKKTLEEVKYLAFGECENGYRFLVNEGTERKGNTGAAGQRSERSRSPASGDAAADSWKQKADEAKRQMAEHKRRQGETLSRRERRALGKSEPGHADKAKSSWRSADAETYRLKGASAKSLTPPEDLDIEWPEDWR